MEEMLGVVNYWFMGGLALGLIIGVIFGILTGRSIEGDRQDANEGLDEVKE